MKVLSKISGFMINIENDVWPLLLLRGTSFVPMSFRTKLFSKKGVIYLDMLIIMIYMVISGLPNKI